jgi:malate dehydrogenase
VAQSIIFDYKRLIPSSVYLEGEYGQNDICIGVPAIIGRKGVEEIITLDLNTEEQELFIKSANAVRTTNQILKEMHTLE